MLPTVRGNRGFTVIELLVGISLLIIVVGTTYEFLMSSQRAALTTRDSFMAQSQLRAGVDNITDELRWAEAVTAASGTSLTVRIPQSTPFSMSSPYLVTFAYNSGTRTITRQQDAGPVLPVAYNIARLDGSAGLAFDYYDAISTSLGQTPADLTVVARVRLTIIATANRTSRTFTGDAALRSR